VRVRRAVAQEVDITALSQDAAPPPLSLRFSRNDGHVVIEVAGELDIATAPLLHERLADIIEAQGNLAVVLDLAGLTFIDSSGLTALVTAHKRLAAHGGRLNLTRPCPATRRAIEITGLHRVLTVT